MSANEVLVELGKIACANMAHLHSGLRLRWRRSTSYRRRLDAPRTSPVAGFTMAIFLPE
jgi:hypothetical protein